MLGVDEDAARKRVTRALARVTDFFRARGFALPAAGGAAVFGQAVKAAPVGLAGTAGSAGLAAGGAATGLNLLLLHIMALTKTQATVLCALLAAGPLAWQSRVVADVRREQADLARQVAALTADQAAGEEESGRLREEIGKARMDSAAARTRLAAVDAKASSKPVASAPAKPYRWNDESPVARVPKEMLKRIQISGAANRRGELTPEIRAALQLTEMETVAVQSAIDRFVSGYHRALAKLSRRADPAPDELQGRARDDVRVFEVAGLREPVNELKQGFFADLGAVLDLERTDMLRRSLDDWMPFDEERHGMNTCMAIFDRDHRVRFFNLGDDAAPAADPVIGYGIVIPGYGSFTATINASEIPDFMRPEVQGWIDSLRQKKTAAPPVTDHP